MWCITDFAICFNVYLKCSLTCLLDSCRILAWCLVQPLSGCGASIDLTLFSNRSNSLYGGHHEWPSEYQDFATGPVLPSLTNSTIRYMFFCFFGCNNLEPHMCNDTYYISVVHMHDLITQNIYSKSKSKKGGKKELLYKRPWYSWILEWYVLHYISMHDMESNNHLTQTVHLHTGHGINWSVTQIFKLVII